MPKTKPAEPKTKKTAPEPKHGVRHEMVVEQLMHEATRLFAQYGVAGTSMQQLAEAVGLTRTGVYYYFKSKNEMLEALVEGFTLDTANHIENLASAEDEPGIERLKAAVHYMICKVAQSPERFRLLLTSEGAFSDELGKHHRRARRRTLNGLVTLVKQAVDEGACKPVDPELAAFSLLGTSNWVAFWHTRSLGPEGARALTPEQTADGLTPIAIGGLLADRVAPNGSPITHLLGLLREDIDRLEQIITRDP
jgi:AcrR family transcriptional regulator